MRFLKFVDMGGIGFRFRFRIQSPGSGVNNTWDQ